MIAPGSLDTGMSAGGVRHMREVVHIALPGDSVAMCDASINRSAPRAAEPEQASCNACIDTYVEGWAATLEDLPPGAPPMPTHPPHRRPPGWLYAVAGAAAMLAVAATYWLTSDGGSGDIAVTVVDCSQTQLYRAEGDSAMLPARVAQIQYVNNGDQTQTFSAQVDGVTLIGPDGRPSTFTLAPHNSKTINYPMNPKKYGNSEGACYALNAGAAQS